MASETLPNLSDSPIRAGKTFQTQGDLVAYAAAHPLNTQGLVGFTGSVQQLDPAAF